MTRTTGIADATIIGAGVVGLSLAILLSRAGWRVELIDTLPPGSGASFGNAGLISVDSPIPMNLPGTLGKVPRWLMDSEGPLSLHARRLPAASGYLARWARASNERRALQVAIAMRALHGSSFDHWRDLLGAADFDRLVRRKGQVLLWDGDAISRTTRGEFDLRKRFGIVSEPLDRQALDRLLPGLDPRVQRGLLLPGNGHLADPGEAMRALAHGLLSSGTVIRAEQVQSVRPDGSGAWTVQTNLGTTPAQRVVLAAGAASVAMAGALGVDLPLESERGYHVEVPGAAEALPLPIIHKDRNFGVTPMSRGLRATGFVEIAGMSAPPDPGKAKTLLRRIKALLPGIDVGGSSNWLGHRPATPDSLPLLGEARRHRGLWIATGNGHYGMTGGPPSAALVADLMLGRTPRLDPAPYRYDRFRHALHDGGSQ